MVTHNARYLVPGTCTPGIIFSRFFLFNTDCTGYLKIFVLFFSYFYMFIKMYVSPIFCFIYFYFSYFDFAVFIFN